MKDTLKKIIFEQQTILQTNNVLRGIDENLIKCNEVLIISGVRRCGKSTLLQQIRESRSEKDFFINFDDERLINFTVADFQILHEVFVELFGEQHTFYFDEIQNIPYWERFIRRLYDMGNKVFITGSNASMLSKELGTHLTGRYVQVELYPFSFTEYLRYKEYFLNEKDIYTTEGRGKLCALFGNYLQQGGFPQYIKNEQAEYLKTLYENILYRDVMVRNNITNERQMLELVRYLAGNVSKLSSYNSLGKIVGVKNATTISNYIQYICNTYLLFQVHKFDFSLKKQIQNPKKMYFIDTAIVQKLGFRFSENKGRLLENLIFIELKRRGKEVFYHQHTNECDFVIRQDTHIIQAIQVTYSIEDDITKKREISGLQEAMEMYHLPSGLLITMDSEDTMEIKGKTIHIVSAWKWLLNK